MSALLRSQLKASIAMEQMIALREERNTLLEVLGEVQSFIKGEAHALPASQLRLLITETVTAIGNDECACELSLKDRRPVAEIQEGWKRFRTDIAVWTKTEDKP